MSDIKLLDDRIKNMTVGLLGMAENETMTVSKSFMQSVRDYMVELLEYRRADPSGEGNGMIVEPDNEPTCGEKENFVQTKYGYCFYALDSNPLIYNLYVHPQYRRCGHSKGLLDLVINEVRKSGHKGEIHIQARPREGIGMEDLTMYYKRMGLSVCDRQKPEGGEGK